jgi:phosphatidylglycerophosphatase A
MPLIFLCSSEIWGASLNSSIRKTVVLLSTWFGCGYLPKVPGTFGTLGAIPLVWLFQQTGETRYLLFTLAFTVVSIYVAQLYEDTVATEHDPSEFVLDEVAGFLVTMTWVPFTWQWVLAGFVLFRILDMVKPFPISWIDRRIPGGVGAMADDLVAGILANIILQFLLQRT